MSQTARERRATPIFLLVTSLILASPSGPPLAVADQQPAAPASPQAGVFAVTRMQDLLPATDSERAEARFFDHFGGREPLRAGNASSSPLMCSFLRRTRWLRLTANFSRQCCAPDE
jgi:hypothetical protein